MTAFDIKYYIFTIICFITIISCSHKENYGSIENYNDFENSSISMIVEQEYNSVQFIEPINKDKHGAFFSNNTMSTSRQGYNYGVTMPTDQIPIWKYNKSLQTIYMDGSTDYEMEFSIIDDKEYNALLRTAESVVDFNKIPSKVHCSNGVMTLYGPQNNLLYSCAYELPDMTEFRDTVRYYMELCEQQTKSSGSGNVTDVNYIKKVMQKKGYDISKIDISVIDDNTIMFSEELEEYNMRLSGIKLYAPIVRKTVLSSDLTKIYKSYTYSGTQLLSQSKYKYSTSDKFNISHINGNAKFQLPSRIETMQLIMVGNHPMVQIQINSYVNNRIIVYNY